MSHASPALGGTVRPSLPPSPVAPPPQPIRAFAFLVEAEADPGFLPRLVTAVARLGLAPRRLQVDSADESEPALLFVNLQLAGVTAQQAETMRERVAGMIGVTSVRLLPVPSPSPAYP